MAVMQALAVAGIGVGLLLLYFSLEVLGLGQRLRRIPLRIAITGTRGKSSVTRLLAACLRDSGIRVVARTTGSKPCFIHPDGTEAEIRRIGFPSILEGKKLVARAADLRAEALVVELMGIQPESLRCESLRVFSPQILVITNVRKDHVEALGRRRGEIARHLAAAIPDKSTVFLPQEEYDSAFDERAGRTGSKLVLVPEEECAVFPPERSFPASVHPQNLRLALAVAEFLNIARQKALKAASSARADFGSLRAWELEGGEPPRHWVLVSAFAANDPESTKHALAILEKRGVWEGKRRIGLLNLRSDRADRSIQWLEALRETSGWGFDRWVLVGEHGRAFARRLRKHAGIPAVVLGPKSAEHLMAMIMEEEKDGGVLVGLGNMGGIGRLLVEHWEKRGRVHDL